MRNELNEMDHSFWYFGMHSHLENDDDNIRIDVKKTTS